MIRAILAAALLALAAPAHAQPDYANLPGPVCAKPEVLRIVAETLGGVAQPVYIEADTTGQLPTSRPDVVVCAVRYHRQAYDTNRFGRAQIDQVGTYQFILDLRQNGIFVR